MKKRKFIGVILILLSILLQVGYAATNNQNQIINTKDFDVYFGSPINYQTSNEDIKINITTEDDTTLSIAVENLYPGGSFTIEPSIKNFGQISANIKAITLAMTQEKEDDSIALYDKLVGYDENQQTIQGGKAYAVYLTNTYTGKELKPGDTLPLKMEMGLAPEVTDLQNTQLKFAIQFQFEQIVPNPGGGGSGGGGIVNNDNETPNTIVVEPPIEPVPGGEIIPIPVEPVPAGVAIEEPKQQPKEMVLEDESIPGGPSERLPQTGGIPAELIYGLGIALMGSGVVLYRKKR